MTSDADMDYGENDDTEAEVSGNAALRKQIKDANRRAQEAEERAAANETAARRVAFMDAGIPDSPQTKFFMDKYDGPLDADTIRNTAQANGFLSAQEANTAAEVDAISDMSVATQGGQDPEAAGSEEALDRELKETAERLYSQGADPDAVGDGLSEVLERYGKQTSRQVQ